MHVSIVGAGALGRAYGGLLAARGGGVTVSYVARSERTLEPFVIRLGKQRVGVPETRVLTEVPTDADVVLVTVPAPALAYLASLLPDGDAPILLLSPALPLTLARLKGDLPGRAVLAGLAAVAAWDDDDGALRVIVPPAPATRFDPPRAKDRAPDELVRALRRAGVPTRFELGTHENAAATTVGWISLASAVTAAGSFDALLADGDLLAELGEAAREGVELAQALGRAEPFTRFSPLLARPTALRAIVAAGRRLAPDLIAFFEHHFGPEKLLAQQAEMLAEMVALAAQRELPHAGLASLAARLDDAEVESRRARA